MAKNKIYINRILSISLLLIILSSCSVVKKTNRNNMKEISKNKLVEYDYLFLEANRQKMLGNFTNAISLLYQCLEIKPNSDAVMYEIGGINEILKNYEVALKYSKKAVDINPQNKYYKIQLAQIYIITKDYNKAIDIYKGLIENNKNDFKQYYNISALYLKLGMYKEAIDNYNIIEKKFGISELVSLTKQQIYLELGKRQKAYDELKKLNKLFPEDPKYYGLLAEMYTDDNNFDEAKIMYEKLFYIDKNNSLGLLSELNLYRKNREYNTFFEKLNNVVNSDDIPINSKVLIFVSILNSKNELLNNADNIETSIDSLVLKYPLNTDVRTIYSDYLIKSKKYESAITELEFVIKNSNANYPVWEQILSLYSYLGKTEQLLQKSKIAVDSFPENPKVYFFAGISCLQLEKYKESTIYFEKGLTKIKDDKKLELDSYTYLGEAYHSLGDNSKSDKYFEKVINEQPNNQYVINNYSYYLSLREVNLDRAEELSKRTIISEPNNSTYLDTYAWILFKLEKYKESLVYIQKAIENGKDISPTLYSHYGDILYKNNLIQDAIYFWKKAKELGDNSPELLEKINTKKFK